MARLLRSDRTQREAETDADSTVRELDLRTAVLGLGALGAGFFVGRRLRRPGALSPDDLRERAGEALPGDGVDVPIGGDDEGEETDASGADPTLEEIDERTESDIQSEPAEPGEMHVDEDLVEEAVEEDDEE